MSALPQASGNSPHSHFTRIVSDIQARGWSFIPGFLDPHLWSVLFTRARDLADYHQAGLGRGRLHRTNPFIRNDDICWLDSGYGADAIWLGVMEQLRLTLNRHFFLGLFEFESHYAVYPVGGVYRRHLDAFKGEGNRVVSVVLYLNPDWQPADGGELVIYPESEPGGLRFLPAAGSLAVFLSEELPHEVLASRRTRYSIAGWFRLNNSSSRRPDPPG